MENEQKQKIRTKHPNRVTLSPESLTRLGAWMEEMGGHLKGNRVNRNDLVNFLILSHANHLTEKEITELASLHFDEVRFAEWALKQLKEARAQGKSLSLTEVIGSHEVQQEVVDASHLKLKK